jgi:two-component system cell cycle response regulator DivK
MTRKVLVVEDDLLNRMFYVDALAASGYSVAEVADGAVVMAEVARFQPDLITMDIQLPNVSGLRLIRQLRRKAATRAVPIIAITAFAGRGEEARCRAAGASNYLSKPVTMEQLIAAIDEALS